MNLASYLRTSDNKISLLPILIHLLELKTFFPKWAHIEICHKIRIECKSKQRWLKAKDNFSKACKHKQKSMQVGCIISKYWGNPQWTVEISLDRTSLTSSERCNIGHIFLLLSGGLCNYVHRTVCDSNLRKRTHVHMNV